MTSEPSQRQKIKRRRCGLSFPPHPLQILSWVFFVLIVAGFYLFYIQCFPVYILVLLVLIYTMILSVLLLSYFTATLMNPADVQVYKSEEDNHKFYEETRAKPNPDDAICYYCNTCEKYVQKRSRHCRECNKCVDTFDHHCKWINNCVGKRNYWPFFIMLTSVFVLMIFQLFVGCVIILYFVVTESTQTTEAGDYLDKWYPGFNKYAWFAITVVWLVLPGALILLVGQLWLFHINLIMKGLTTYEFIIAERKRKKAIAEGTIEKRPNCIMMMFLVCICERGPLSRKSKGGKKEKKGKDGEKGFDGIVPGSSGLAINFDNKSGPPSIEMTNVSDGNIAREIEAGDANVTVTTTAGDAASSKAGSKAGSAAGSPKSAVVSAKGGPPMSPLPKEPSGE